MRIAVIGSGVCGASVAYHASVSGAEVVVVDQNAAGRATDAGAGIVCPWTSRLDDPHWHALATRGARYYPELVSALGEAGAGDTGYRRVGALRLASDATELDRLHRTVLARREHAPEAGEVDLLNGGETRELFPPLRGDRQAVRISGAARVDGRLLRDALLAGARRWGARMRTGTATLHEEGSGWELGVDGESVEADTAVVAAGAWTAGLLAEIGRTVDVTPQRGQIVHLGLPDADTSRWPVVLPPGNHYLLAFDDSRVVVGATREEGSGFDHRVTAGGLNEVLTEAVTVAPGLAAATHLETRIGFRPMSADNLPLLGRAGDHNLVVATGLGASGLTLGPYVGALAATLATGGEPDVDLAPYDPLRRSAMAADTQLGK